MHTVGLFFRPYKRKQAMKKLLLTLCCLAGLTACHHHDDEAPEAKTQAERTVIVYMAGENNLTDAVWDDLKEMKEGSRLIGNNHLVVFVDRSSQRELPWMACLKNGQIADSVSISDVGIGNTDIYSSDPQVMEQIFRYAVNNYPASEDYGLVLWGHSSGWLVQDSIPNTRAFGIDNGRNDTSMSGYWINIPTLATVIANSLPHLKFIFADCCNFMCLESLYELRHAADYIIGSPAEIPYDGAPYERVVPALFEKTAFATSVVEEYQKDNPNYLPLSVVKTSEMEIVAQATRIVLQSMNHDATDSYPDMTGLIYYYYMGGTKDFQPENRIFFDAGDYIRTHASAADYQQWKQALDKAVVEKVMATQWQTDKLWKDFYSDFNVTEESYHGVSIYVPQDPHLGYNSSYRRDVEKFQWYHVVGL